MQIRNLLKVSLHFQNGTVVVLGQYFQACTHWIEVESKNFTHKKKALGFKLTTPLAMKGSLIIDRNHLVLVFNQHLDEREAIWSRNLPFYVYWNLYDFYFWVALFFLFLFFLKSGSPDGVWQWGKDPGSTFQWWHILSLWVKEAAFFLMHHASSQSANIILVSVIPKR